MIKLMQLKYEAIVVGVSAGGLTALTSIFGRLPVDFPVPCIVVQHRARDEKNLLEEVLQAKMRIRVKQADEKEKIEAPCIYFAPPDYHLLIETDRTFSLSSEAPVNFSRPSIDVLFETAAAAYKNKLLGIVLTGANSDGAEGIRTIRKYMGTTIAQDPGTAQFPAMPEASIATGCVQHILNLSEIEKFLLQAA